MAAVPPVVQPAAPPPVAAKKKRSLGSSLFGWVSTKGCTHALKLRHQFKVDERSRMELGLDLDVRDDQSGVGQMLQNSAPWAAFWYKIDPEDEAKGTLEINPLWVSWNKKFTVGKKDSWWEVPLDTKLGATYTGKPYVKVNIGNLPLALGLAAVVLAAGKSISVERKEVGGLAVGFSGGYKMHERLEFDARLRREGCGLRLDFSQLNGVLRLQQDEE